MSSGCSTAGWLASQRHVLCGQARCLGTDQWTWSWLVGGSGCSWERMALTKHWTPAGMSGLESRSYPSPETNLLLLSLLGNRCYEDPKTHGETATAILFGTSLYTHLRIASRIGPKLLLSVDTSRKSCHKTAMRAKEKITRHPDIASTRQRTRILHRTRRHQAHETESRNSIPNICLFIFWYIIPDPTCHFSIARVPILRQSSMCLKRHLAAAQLRKYW